EFREYGNMGARGVVLTNNFRTSNAVAHQVDVTPCQPDSLNDAVLVPGGSLAIPIRNISITTVSVDASGAVVDVVFSTPGENVVDLLASAPCASQSAPAHGETITFTAQVKNQGTGSAHSSRVRFCLDN